MGVCARAPSHAIQPSELSAGDRALLVVDWAIEAAGLRGTATDVARRRPDGSWRCAIDNPDGTARSVDLPASTAAALAGEAAAGPSSPRLLGAAARPCVPAA